MRSVSKAIVFFIIFQSLSIYISDIHPETISIFGFQISKIMLKNIV